VGWVGWVKCVCVCVCEAGPGQARPSMRSCCPAGRLVQERGVYVQVVGCG
jgi:hypothetical protein